MGHVGVSFVRVSLFVWHVVVRDCLCALVCRSTQAVGRFREGMRAVFASHISFLFVCVCVCVPRCLAFFFVRHALVSWRVFNVCLCVCVRVFLRIVFATSLFIISCRVVVLTCEIGCAI